MAPTQKTPLKRGTRARILALLREHDCTVRDLAGSLHLTNNAIRARLAGLESEGLIRRGGLQTGVRKPHVVYTLTESAAHAFPNAYGLLLRQLVEVLTQRLNPRTVAAYLREVGRQLAAEPARKASGKTAEERQRMALGALQSIGGEAALTEKDGRKIIEGKSCPLAAVTASHPTACAIAEALLSEIIGQPVKQVCLHGGKPRCRFELSGAD